MSRWMFAVLTAGVLIAGGVVSAEEATVTIASGGGNFQEAQKKAHWEYASQATGIPFAETTSANGLNDVKLQVESGAVSWDIVNISLGEGLLGGEAGLLEPIDANVVDTSALVPGTALPYCVGNLTFATVLGWSTEAFEGKAPASWADFWNVEAFPGPRGMWNRPEGNLEIALMADGVPAAEVYQVLSTEDGYERAFRKLEEIAPHVTVWWTSGAQHAQAIADGEVVMTTGWNGRFATVQKDGAPVDYTFNQGVVSTDCYAVPKGAPHKAEAMRFINETIKPQPQADLTQYIPYGPTNPQAFETGAIAADVESRLPTFPANLKTEVVNDAGWWKANLDRVQKRYEQLILR